MTSTLSLTGKQYIHPLNLTGKSINNGCSQTSPAYVVKIKRVIFDRFITPILSKNWKILKENMFQINYIIKRLTDYYEALKDETLLLYKYTLSVIKSSFDTNEELSNLEGKLFDGGDAIAKMIVRVPKVRLMPERELYNLILGKPQKNEYDKKIIADISNLLKHEYITFSEISSKIKQI